MNDTDTWPKGAPDPHLRAYRLFTTDESEAALRARFADRYGEEPEHVFAHKGLIWAGPIPQGKEKCHG